MSSRVRALSCVVAVVLSQIVSAGQAPSQSWQSLDARVDELYSRGDLRAAIDVAQSALHAASSPAESGRSLDRLGFLYYTSGDLPQGEKYLRQSLATRESAFGPDSLEAAETANDLAMLLRDLRRMDEARALAQRAVDVRERRRGAHSLPLAESLDTLGTVLGLAGDYDAAVARFERALAIQEERPATERASEEYGTLCVNLAGTYQRLGKYAAAESTFGKGLDALRITPGVNHPAYAASELAYAALEVDLGRYVEAERLYDEGGRLVVSELGDHHPVYATLLNNRGFFYQSIGNVAAALADYQRSLDLKRQLYGAGSLLTVSTLRNLAHLTYSLDHVKGEALLAQTVDAYARLPNAPPFDYASTLIGLARAQRDRGAIGEARSTAEKAVDVSRKGIGERHPLYASATRELGLTLAAAGDAQGAERLLGAALNTAEEAYGSPDHPDLAPFLDALADFYSARRDFTAAQPLYARSLGIQDRFLGDVLEIGSENFKAQTMAAASDSVSRLIAFQSAAPAASARALAFEAVVTRKGRVIDQVRQWRRQLEADLPAALQRQVSEWHAVVGCRTSLTVALSYRDLKPPVAAGCSLDGTDLEGRFERLLSDLRTRWTADVGARAVAAIKVLQERAETLESALNRRAGAAIGAVHHVSVDDVRARLTSDEALVELVSYAARGDAGSRGERRYGAFVLTTHGSPDFVDLGDAAVIDESVGDLLEAAGDWSISAANHETEAGDTSRRTAQQARVALSRHVLRPIEPLIGGAITRLRIAPDGLLNLVPFEALIDGGGRDLIDRFSISYVPAGRDLVSPHTPHPSTAPVIVVSPGAGAGRSRTAATSPVTFRTDSLGVLQGAMREAADIMRLVPGAALYVRSEAAEQQVKQLRGPALLHIVGHGVVRDAEDCAGAPCGSAALTPATQAMTLAAVVLEEAYGRAPRSGEDGLLTALELQNMDLRGTEMLVLSQCRMASGLASVGEGVYGMRRAADVAGANSFVAPLWNVDDQVQRRLMKRFYEELAAGHGRGDALRRAKLAVRATPATSSFLYWAPVILSGSAAPIPPSIFRR